MAAAMVAQVKGFVGMSDSEAADAENSQFVRG